MLPVHTTYRLFHMSEPNIRKQLKDVGLDLVANLTLLESGFGRQVKETVAWWEWVIADLEKGEQSSLVPLDKSSAGNDPEALKKAYAWWEQAKEGWQAYYDIVSIPGRLPCDRIAHGHSDCNSAYRVSRPYHHFRASVGWDDGRSEDPPRER